MVPNVPAIHMEEVLPIAVSKSATLAPEEVYVHNKAAARGDSELTHEDRKRKRRRIKEQHRKYEEERARRKRIRDGGKQTATTSEALKSIKGSKQVTVAKPAAPAGAGAGAAPVKHAKSKMFFAKLQQEREGVDGRTAARSPKQRDHFATQASFLKL